MVNSAQAALLPSSVTRCTSRHSQNSLSCSATCASRLSRLSESGSALCPQARLPLRLYAPRKPPLREPSMLATTLFAAAPVARVAAARARAQPLAPQPPSAALRRFGASSTRSLGLRSRRRSAAAASRRGQPQSHLGHLGGPKRLRSRLPLVAGLSMWLQLSMQRLSRSTRSTRRWRSSNRNTTQRTAAFSSRRASQG